MNIELARASDRQELIDFLLSVFKGNNPNHAPFDKIYPDLFLADDEVMGRHAVIREGGRIAACVGTYPMLMQVGGCRIKTVGVGQVATAKASTGKGYMTALLIHELDRCRREGCVLGWLGGRRDRYSRFGFDIGSLSYDFHCDAHSLRGVVLSRVITHVDALAEDAITDAMFALRDKTVNSVIEPPDTFRMQMGRLGFKFEIWSATPSGGAEPDAWAVVDMANKRIEEWCGSLQGRLEILRAVGEALGTVNKMETWIDAQACKALRSLCTYLAPSGRMLAVLDKDGLLDAARPLLPPDFKMPADDLSPCELVQALFGPDPGSSACLPFAIPGIFHV